MKKRARRLLWLAFAVMLGAGLTLAVVFGRARPEVEVAPITRGTFEQSVTEDGRTRVRDRFIVAAPIGGILERTHLRVGDTLARGSVVAALRPVPGALIDVRTRSELEQRVGAARAELDRMRAGADRAEAARAHAESELSTAKELAAKGAISPRERDHAQLDSDLATKERDAARVAVHVAEHEVEIARAALASASRTAAAPAESFEIKAPVEGRVLRIYQESEGPIALGAPILEIADSTALEIVVDLLSTDAVNIETGAEAVITGWGRSIALPARVRRVEPTATTKISALGVEEQRVNVILDPTSTHEAWARLGDGYRVDVQVLVERLEGTLRIPTSALFREGGEWSCFVVKGGRLQKRTAKLRIYGPQLSAVEQGVEEGEEVVVQPSQTLEVGAPVRARASR